MKNGNFLKNESGISSIEFLLTFAMTLSALFMFIRTAYLYTNGYMAHYANFMASRTYMVYESLSNTREGSYTDAEVPAKKVFSKYQQLPIGIPQNTSLKFNRPMEEDYIYVGTWFEYEDQYSFSKSVGGTKKLKLVTESFLGREPTRAECLARICHALNEAGSGMATCAFGNTIKKNMTFFDNGC